MAHPDVTVELGTDTFPATAQLLSGAERDEVYAKQVAAEPQFDEYQRKTERTVPVVELGPGLRHRTKSGTELLRAAPPPTQRIGL